MSLNNIVMPPELIVNLYRNTLVENSAMPVPQKGAVDSVIDYLGENKKQVLILVDQKAVPFLPEKETKFLTTVLSACGLNLSHVAIVNKHTLKESAEAAIAQLAPKQILFLDVQPSQFGFDDAPHYTVQVKDNIQFVFAPALSQIEKTKEAKSRFWLALKQIFGL